ncbi:MAG: putative lipid II flippase FtsW [Gaiellaceae bacterium]
MRKGLEAQVLVLVTLALLAFGLVMVYSATSAPAAVGDSDPGYYVKRQALAAVVGLALLAAAARVPFQTWRRLAPVLLVASAALLVAVLLVAEPINGARRWIEAGPATFQPSEFAKLGLATWAAAYLARARPPRTLAELARPLGLVAAVFCALLLLEPDLGTAIAMTGMLGAMLLVSGTPLRTLALGGSVAVVLGLAAIWAEPYRRARIFAFLNPWDDAQGAGFQTVQAMIGLGSGGILGVGIGEGVQKVFYLPEAHTDMIFAIIGEEVGLVGTAALMAAYVAFAHAGFNIALRCRDPFGKRLAAGLTVLVCGQAALNLAAVMGLAPLTGIPLPFVSYGGSSLVVALASVGVLLNIAGQDARSTAARVPDRRRGDGRPRAAGPRRGGVAAKPRRAGDLRRVAGAGRGTPRP